MTHGVIAGESDLTRDVIARSESDEAISRLPRPFGARNDPAGRFCRHDFKSCKILRSLLWSDGDTFYGDF